MTLIWTVFQARFKRFLIKIHVYIDQLPQNVQMCTVLVAVADKSS